MSIRWNTMKSGCVANLKPPIKSDQVRLTWGTLTKKVPLESYSGPILFYV